MVEPTTPRTGPARSSSTHAPAHYTKSLGLHSKTDQLDARALASYGVRRRPTTHVPLIPACAALRELSRRRQDLIGRRRALKNQIGEHPKYYSKKVRQLDRRQLKQLNRDIGQIEKEIRALIRRHAKLAEDYDLLVSLPGVAFVTATVILADLGDLRGFATARKI